MSDSNKDAVAPKKYEPLTGLTPDELCLWEKLFAACVDTHVHHQLTVGYVMNGWMLECEKVADKGIEAYRTRKRQQLPKKKRVRPASTKITKRMKVSAPSVCEVKDSLSGGSDEQ